MALREDALIACYRRLERPLYNVLYRHLWQAQECEDLLHDAFVRVWERRAQVDPVRLDALVWTTALHLARNRMRWHRLRQFVAIDETELEAGAMEPADFLATRRLRRALQSLPRTAREVLLLSEFSGLTGAEIAQVLGIPPGTVASRKHHAMARLRALLESPNA